MAVFKANDMYAGRYLLEKLVGEGGFSEVWKAKDIMADEATVAIKIYAPEKGLEEFGIKQFRKEYSITHHLAHPHLMKVFYFDIAGRSPYLIMPYYKLGSLSNLLYEQGSLDERQIALFMFQVGGALEELHKQEPIILHQDIKPDNILIQEPDHFILTDFGISSQTRHTLSKSTGSFKSLTIAYAPPERFDKNPASNEASDIFSLGVTLYETCTGQVPWEGNGGQSLLKGAQVPDLPSKFPRELNKMIQACMCLDSSERPSASKIKSWGKFYLDNSYWKFADDEKTKPINLKKIVFAGIALLLLLGVVGFLYYKFPMGGSNESEAADSTTNTGRPEVASNSEGAVALPSDSDSNNNFTSSTGTEMADPIEPVPTTENGMVSIDTIKKVSIAKPKADPANYAKPKDIEGYLNQLSNPAVPRNVRKEWKKEAIAYFANENVLVLDKHDALSKRYTVGQILNLLLDIPHKTKVLEVLMDQHEKITEMHIQTSLF